MVGQHRIGVNLVGIMRDEGGSRKRMLGGDGMGRGYPPTGKGAWRGG